MSEKRLIKPNHSDIVLQIQNVFDAPTYEMYSVIRAIAGVKIFRQKIYWEFFNDDNIKREYIELVKMGFLTIIEVMNLRNEGGR